jgi:hypothetical protein
LDTKTVERKEGEPENTMDESITAEFSFSKFENPSDSRNKKVKSCKR